MRSVYTFRCVWLNLNGHKKTMHVGSNGTSHHLISLKDLLFMTILEQCQVVS